MTNILITGANRGIGLEFVNQYINREDRVIATCRNMDNAEELKSLQMLHADLSVLELDVSSTESVRTFMSELGSQAVDIFINNAGVYGPRNAGFGSVSAKEWLEVLKVNTLAPLLLTQALLNNLRSGKDKKLIYITSKMGSIEDNGSGGSYIYRSSKTALNQVVKSIAIDLMEEEFTAIVVHPGWVLTDMGGPNALIDAETSVSGMTRLIDNLERKDSGGFFNYDGSTVPW